MYDTHTRGSGRRVPRVFICELLNEFVDLRALHLELLCQQCTHNAHFHNQLQDILQKNIFLIRTQSTHVEDWVPMISTKHHRPNWDTL